MAFLVNNGFVTAFCQCFFVTLLVDNLVRLSFFECEVNQAMISFVQSKQWATATQCEHILSDVHMGYFTILVNLYKVRSTRMRYAFYHPCHSFCGNSIGTTYELFSFL